MRIPIFIAMLALAFAGAAHSEPRKLVITLDCDTVLQNVLDIVQEEPYLEQPFAIGKGVVVMTAAGDQPKSVGTMFAVNPTTGSYTIIISFAEGGGCILVPGGDFAPVGANTVNSSNTD